VPAIQTPGNHELCPEPYPVAGKFADVNRFVARFKDYNAYWPSPQFPEQTANGPTAETLQPVGPVPSGPVPETGMQNRNQYHAHTIPGIGTIISLSNYIIWEDYGVAQLEWLRAQLQAIDRSKQPWLVVMWHASWYSTYSKHWRETECMRRAYEPLFRQYKVDVVINGHNHAYERTKPMYNWQPDASGCGTVHLMIGGGCADDLTFGYLDEERAIPYLKLKPSTCPLDNPDDGKVCPYSYCSNPSNFHIPGYQVRRLVFFWGGGGRAAACPVPFCLYSAPPPPKKEQSTQQQPPMLAATKYQLAPACALPSAEFPEPLCPPASAQSPYSAYRRQTYGVGQLELLSATRARWSWYANNRNKNGPSSATDSVILSRDPSLSCAP
jgi:hypothetical protein